METKTEWSNRTLVYRQGRWLRQKGDSMTPSQVSSDYNYDSHSGSHSGSSSNPYGFKSKKIRQDVPCFSCAGLGWVRGPTRSIRCMQCEVDENELPAMQMDDNCSFVDESTIPEFIWKRAK